jgi:hypothetical protein
VRRSLAFSLAVALAAALGGCGSHKAPGSLATPPKAPAAAPPHGKLTTSEFRHLLVAMTQLDAVQRLHKPTLEASRLDKVCSGLSGPQTALFAAIRADCRGSATLYRSILGVKTGFQDCTVNAPPGDPSCYVHVLSDLRRAAAAALVTTNASVTQLARRGLHGRCAAVIGANRAAMSAVAALRSSAGDAASALSNGDAPDYLADLRRIGHSMTLLGHSSYHGSQRRAILTCPHS